MTVPAGAQQAGKVYRVGFLIATSSTPGARGPSLELFRQSLREHGWVEGQNVVFDYRFSEGRSERLPELAAELVRLDVDVIVAVPTAEAARDATRTIPIVMLGPADPVERGLVASLARPGGNVTGWIYSPGVEIFSKQLELLREMVPQVRRMAILANPANPTYTLWKKKALGSVASLGVQLRLHEVRSYYEFDGAFMEMSKEGVEAVLVWGDPLLDVYRKQLVDLIARSRLAAVYTQRAWVEAGGLMSYAPRFLDFWRLAARYVDKILRGAKPADLPVEQPTKFEFIVNLKTAKALGLKVPQSILLRADEVIQ